MKQSSSFKTTTLVQFIMALLVLQILTVACKQKGNTERQDKAEWIKNNCKDTGREVWQITSDSVGSVACYFERQAFTSDDRYLVFSSKREGKWRLFRADMADGIIVPLTPLEREINDDDYTIHPDGKQACYMDGNILYGINISSFEEKVLFNFSDSLREKVFFSGSFTADGNFTLVSLRDSPIMRIYRINLKTGEVLLAHEQDTGRFSHPLINPSDPDIITYVPGPDTQNDMSLPMERRARTWKINLRDGTQEPFLTCPYGFRATHESWSADGSRFFFYRKTVPGWMPVTICSISKQGDDLREYHSSDTIRLGHGISSQDGKWFISDSQDPGRNPLTLLNLESGENTILNWPDASTQDGQFTHVHPFFSTSGKFVSYTSDVSGVPQVYVVPVGDLTSP
ncbi:oligogalacturonate lyase family protein [Bacteroidota bacterium]